MIASTMVRASAKGLPLRPVGRGSMSAIIDHWASESTWNLDIWPVSQDGRYIFVRHALGLSLSQLITLAIGVLAVVGALYAGGGILLAYTAPIWVLAAALTWIPVAGRPAVE